MLTGPVLMRIAAFGAALHGKGRSRTVPAPPSRIALFHLTLFRFQLLVPGEDGEAKL